MIDLWNQGIAYFTEQGVSYGIAATYLVVSALIVVMAVVTFVMQIMVIIKYLKGNKTRSKSGKNSLELAREVLDKNGLSDVKIKKAGFLRAFIFGNSYSVAKKTIFLRKNIINKDTITSIALAIQKAGIAKQCESGDKKAIARYHFQLLGLFGPVLFIPIILLGFILDLLLLSTFGGGFSICGIVVSLLIVLVGFIANLLNIPVEKKANEFAMDMIQKSGVLDEEEMRIVADIYQAYIISYVCEFLVSVLRLVQVLLEVVMGVQINNRSSNS